MTHKRCCRRTFFDFFVDAINDEHRFIFFDHHRIVWSINQLMRERNFIYELIQIINKWIITIKIVNNAFSQKIVKLFVNKHAYILKWSQICHICKFNIRDIIFCCFLIVNFLVIIVIAVFLKQSSVLISFRMSMSIIFLIEKKNFRDFKIAFLNHFLFCWLHFQFEHLTNFTMCLQFSQLCMISYKHCRFSLLSFFVEIENVDFCDWDWDCD
jgi:hypothetical protein